MLPADITKLVALSRPTLGPDGRTAVVAATRPDLDGDAYVGQLWSVDVAGERQPRRITQGFRDSAPQFSPDGATLAFLRAAPGEPAQLFVMPAPGGEPVRVTERLLGVDEFAWSPDAGTLAFVSREPEAGRYGTVEGVDAASEPPRRFTTLRNAANGVGWMRDRRPQVFVVPAPDPFAAPVVQPTSSVEGPAEKRATVTAPCRLTHDDADHGGIAFSPDGRWVAVVSDGHATADEDLLTTLTLVAVDGGEVRVVVPAEANLSIAGGSGSVAFTADGTVYLLAQDMGPTGRDFVAKHTSLYAVGAHGGTPRRLTDPQTTDLGEAGSMLAPTHDGVLSLARARGRVQLVRVTSTGTVVELVGDREVTGVAATGNTVVFTSQDSSTFGALAELANGGVRTLLDFSAELHAAGIRTPLEFEATGRDGHPIHGWVALPDGEGPHPVLLNIHGGPFAQYSVQVFDETQVYARAGYAVVYCNPRGSAGYGEAHGRAIKGGMGTVDMHDVLDFLEAAVAAHPALDGDRVGILGGSYGGYLTAWTIAHDHRFAAAIVERGYLDPDVFVGTSDIGSYFSDEYTGTDAQRVRAQSPQAHADLVRTPTLVMHSENDLRCPLSQGERYFAALKRNGVPTELVVFPGEDHELSRAGRPRHRVQRFDIILQWWARHLPTPSNPAPVT